MGRRLASVLATIALVAGASPCAAADDEEITWYVIEMIVFERTAEAGRDAEAWPAEPGLPQLADAIALTVEGLTPEDLARSVSPTEAEPADEPGETVPKPMHPVPRAFRLLPPEEHRLADIRERLERSSAYRPLLQVAWIQPGFPEEQAPLVHLRNGNAALGAAGGESAAPPGGGDAGLSATLSPRITVARDPSKPAIDGTVRVHRARYLHVEADLLYYRPIEGDAAAAPDAASDAGTALLTDSPDTAFIEQLLAEDDAVPRLFRLTEQRRMRSKELHYLDHPMFGVLVQAWPLELPEAPDEPLPPEGDAAQPEAQDPASVGG